MDHYYSVEIPVTDIDIDLLSDIVFSHGALGLEERGQSVICSFLDGFNKTGLLTQLSRFMDTSKIIIEEKQSENWMESWKENFKELKIGDHFVIRPTWIPASDTHRIDIQIDPKMAFGTGTHETTQLILEQLPDLVKKNDHVLDAGTGSGILAIAAEKLGASEVIAFDNDPVAIENCHENIELNQCKHTTAFTGLIDSVNDQFDLVIANINRNILIDISNQLCNALKPGGTLILSGLLLEDKQQIITTFQSVKLMKTADKGEWTCLIFSHS